MIVYVIKKTGLISLILPSRIYGSYWVKDYKDNGDARELINIREQDGKWVANSNKKVSIIIGGKRVESVILQDYQYFILQLNNENIEIYVSPSVDTTMQKLKYKNFDQISIGSDKGNNIVCVNQLVNGVHVVLYNKDNYWYIEDKNTKHGTFINNEIVNGTHRVFFGDIIFIMGFKLIFMNGFIYINNPLDTVLFDKNMFSVVPATDTIGNVEFSDVDEVVELYNESDYFVRTPRFIEVVETQKFVIEAPPNIGEEDKTPLILTMGPMITSGMTSMVYAFSSFYSIQNGANVMSVAPMIVMSVSMLLGTLLWAPLMRRYQKKMWRQKKELRDKKYSEYLLEKEKELKLILENQKQIMLSNYLNSQECYNYIVFLNKYLWVREIQQDSFLNLRLGLGEIDANVNVNCPTERFSLEDDALEKKMHEIVNKNKKIMNAPVILSLTEMNILALVGNYPIIKQYMDTLLLQLLALQSYFDLKIVILTNNDRSSGWEYLGLVPHIWSNDRSIRFLSEDNEDGAEISNYLNQILEGRLNSVSNNSHDDVNYKNFDSYYLIVTDDLKNARDYSVVKKILDHSDKNLGFGLIVLNSSLSNLPTETKSFVVLENMNEGMLLQSELSSKTRQKFNIEKVSNIDFSLYPVKLSNVPMENESSNYYFPKVYGFLEMYDAGLIEQLNPLERWSKNNPIVSLGVPVGIDDSGNLFKLDLHEKAHGPHGLIAGMTGSGKSEFIITYILSMAVNFHPNEVQFVLIDYKGGGLVGAFESKEMKLKLPHLAGTITNLDVADINRALASIESELKRRQRLFNVAREKLNEGTIDIYKYQKYYREGILDEPISHLFIISDEFAELKDQQPDFMDQLISTARIGRSLGVHLILATQKPSGVVDDQIWSNSRFKVCLKVQDANDSNEMIKRPDAASLKDAGRFYLQVGYDEYFALGQAAWAGGSYVPQEKVYHEVDDSLNFVDSIGKSYKTLDIPKTRNTVSMGEELPNIVKYLDKIAKVENINVRNLWLEKIPAIIYVDNLRKKYNYNVVPYHINPIFGEYDDPSTQFQGLATIDFEKNGNTVVYSIGDKNMFVNSIVYSLITSHSSEEVNIYILDMDAEVFKIYNSMPQVGDVIFGSEEEKVKNTLRYLGSEIAKRKQIFQNYNGNYRFYCDNSGSKLPAIVFILTGCENFMELYEKYEDDFLTLTRESEKYGVYCLVTAVSERAMNLRTRNNFPNIIPMKLTDEYDYRMLLGKDCPVISDTDGRGVFLKEDRVFEFQTSSICDSKQFNSYILSLADNLNSKLKVKAPKIPILPNAVSYDDIIYALRDLSSVPIGIEVESLQVSTFNFTKNFVSLINSDDGVGLKNFASLVINEVSGLKDVCTVVLDGGSMYSDVIFSKNILYFNQNIAEQFNAINTNLKKIVFVVGIEAFVNSFANLDAYLSNLQKQGNCWFVFVDRFSEIKKYSFEDWFKKFTNPYDGIWVGKGLGDVTYYKLSTSFRVLGLPIKSNYGYNIIEGDAISVKLLETAVAEADNTDIEKNVDIEEEVDYNE